jgi:nitrous oxidase accessory protein NosD
MERRVRAAIAVAMAVGFFASGADASAAILWASPAGGSGPCTEVNPCTLVGAVAAASSGDVVWALPGLYTGGVVIDKPITLRGFGAVIDAASSPVGDGVQVVGPGGSGSKVEGFTIQGAKFEGILVGTAPVAPGSNDGASVIGGQAVTHVRILNNVVRGNDRGYGSDAGQCDSSPGPADGDCGQAIHLVSVTDSVVADNYITGNSGGVLLSDEFGPTAGNIIINNYINWNKESGVTLASRNSSATGGLTHVPTGDAGVFDNRVVLNKAIVNGGGAGFLLTGTVSGAGVFHNDIRHNVARGNGLPGVAIQQQYPGDLNDNTIEFNILRNDNRFGDAAISPADLRTTGILVASSVGPNTIVGTTICANTTSTNHYGLWTLGVDPARTRIVKNVFGPGVPVGIRMN